MFWAPASFILLCMPQGSLLCSGSYLVASWVPLCINSRIVVRSLGNFSVTFMVQAPRRWQKVRLADGSCFPLCFLLQIVAWILPSFRFHILTSSTTVLCSFSYVSRVQHLFSMARDSKTEKIFFFFLPEVTSHHLLPPWASRSSFSGVLFGQLLDSFCINTKNCLLKHRGPIQSSQFAGFLGYCGH